MSWKYYIKKGSGFKGRQQTVRSKHFLRIQSQVPHVLCPELLFLGNTDPMCWNADS